MLPEPVEHNAIALHGMEHQAHAWIGKDHIIALAAVSIGTPPLPTPCHLPLPLPLPCLAAPYLRGTMSEDAVIRLVMGQVSRSHGLWIGCCFRSTFF